MSNEERKRTPTKEKYAKLILFWKRTKLFSLIDSLISQYYRRRIKNDNFTILCSNCVGGILYHRLGKKFLTPTINMWIPQPDFVEFCVHLDYYLAQDPQFIESNQSFPVGQLIGDGENIPSITLNFNHDKVAEEARAKWNERKKRIVRDNMYIMMYKLDGVTVEQLKRLENVPCRNKVVFTAKPLPAIPWSVCIKPIMTHRDPYNYLEKDMFGVRYLEKKFDYISFLNS